MPMWCEACDRPLPIGLDYCVFCGGSIRVAELEEVRGWLNEHPHQPEPPLAPDEITDIIIESCFHLEKNKGLPVLYSYSEKNLHYLTRIGYEVSGKEDHVLYMRGPKAPNVTRVSPRGGPRGTHK